MPSPNANANAGIERRCAGCDRSITKAQAACAECGTVQGFRLKPTTETDHEEQA